MPVPTARDLMTDRVLTVPADWSLQELAAFLTEHAISGAPVVSDYGGAIGVVSTHDIARHDSEVTDDDDADDTDEPPAYYLGTSAPAAPEALTPLAASEETTVRDIMVPTVFTVDANASIHDVADRMVRGHLHRLLVVNPGTRRDIVGIVSAIDLLEWLRDPTALDAAPSDASTSE